MNVIVSAKIIRSSASAEKTQKFESVSAIVCAAR